MTLELVQSIREAEQQADLIVREARAAARHVAKEARMKAARLREEALAGAEAEADRAVGQAEEEARAGAALMATQRLQQIEQIQAGASLRLPEAVALIIERIEKRYADR